MISRLAPRLTPRFAPHASGCAQSKKTQKGARGLSFLIECYCRREQEENKNKYRVIYRKLAPLAPRGRTPGPQPYANTLNGRLRTCRPRSALGSQDLARLGEVSSTTRAAVSCRCRHPVNPSP